MASKVIVAVCRIGRVSLDIYILQRLFLETYYFWGYSYIMKRVGQNIMIRNIYIFNFLYTPGIAILFAGVIYGLIQILNRRRVYKVALGKQIL